jgi:hypothetical protein
MITLALWCTFIMSVGAVYQSTLIGIHIQADNFQKVHFGNVVQSIREQRNDISTNLFACITNSEKLIMDSVIHSTMVELEIPHFYSSNQYSEIMCALEHPDIEQYEFLLQTDANIDLKSLQLFSIDTPVVESDFSLVYLPRYVFSNLKASLLEASINSTPGAIISLISQAISSASHSTPDSHTLPSTTVVANATAASAVPSRAASGKYHSSGPCNLWWPLDGAEILVYGHYGQSDDLHKHVEPIIMICPQLKNYLANSPNGYAAKKRGVKRLLILEMFNHRRGQSFPLTDSLPGATETLPADSANFEEAVQVMVTMRLPSYATHMRLRLSMCNFNARAQSKHVDKSDCFVDLDVTVRIIWGGNVPLINSKMALHPMVASMDSRDLFGHALKMMGHNAGTFVEVGVNRGHYAKLMMSQWGGNRYVMVDPWMPAPGEEYVDIANAPTIEAHNDVLTEAIRNVEGFGARPVVVRDTSLGAAKFTVNNTVDVVYLDGLHHYHGVMDDIEAWWPKIKCGGVMAGHDYYLMSEAKTIFTVKPAVDEFARKMGLVVFQTHDSYPTWFVFKE